MTEHLYPVDYENRVLDVAHAVLDDIPQFATADYRVRFVGGAPMLVIAFSIPETRLSPALAIRLVTISRSEPMRPGVVLEGDRLRRHIRDATEHYLAKHGIKIPGFQEGN